MKSNEKSLENLSKFDQKIERKSTEKRAQKRSILDRKTVENLRKKGSARRSRRKPLPRRPGDVQGAPQERPGSVPERPGSVPVASRSAPKASQSVSSASPERSGCAPMQPRSLERRPGAIFKRFQVDFGSPGWGLGILQERFFTNFLPPSLCVRGFHGQLRERNRKTKRRAKTPSSIATQYTE